jgi:hypothetical protein
MLGRLIAKSLAVQLILAGYCAAQTADPGAIRVGDRWSYDVKDGLTGDLRHAITIVAAEVNQKEITTRVFARGQDRPPLTIVYDPDWSRIDDGVWKHRPSDLTGIRKPLQIGKEWRSEGNSMNLRSGTAMRTSGVTRAVGQEQVTTPAGTFETFRVESTVRQINTTDQTKSAIETLVIWYSPAINRWVRRTSEFRFDGRLRNSTVEELTEYSRKP